MLTSDMALTEPAAGMMVNSTGRTRAAWPFQFLCDKLDTWLELLTLWEPDPSPRTRREKFIGTKDVLKRVHVNVAGKPGTFVEK